MIVIKLNLYIKKFWLYKFSDELLHQNKNSDKLFIRNYDCMRCSIQE